MSAELTIDPNWSTKTKVETVCQHQSGRPVAQDSRLAEDLDLDSLDRIDLAVQFERTFNIDIPDADVDDPSLGTVAGLTAYIERRLTA